MIDKSQKEFAKAKQYIAGGVNSPVRSFASVGGEPLFIKSASGAYVYDIDDNKYLDFVCSWGPMILGHSDGDVNNAIIKQLAKGLSYGAPTKVETKLAKKIISIYDCIDKVRFVSSGTEATMSAIRLARGYTGKNNIIKFNGCYHGHSDALLVKAGSGLATHSKPSSLGVPKNTTKNTLLCQYNDIDELKEVFKIGDIACVIIEPIAGNMGLVPADMKFLKAIKELCDKHDTLLIFDEVMSGFRASLKGAYGIVGIEPDIVTFGKVIGGGMPVGAFGAKEEIMDYLSPVGGVYQAGTLSGNPIAMEAGLATLQKISEDENFYNALEEKAEYLMSGIKKVADIMGVDFCFNIRGSMFGMFFAKELPKNIDDVAKGNEKHFIEFFNYMLKRGFYFAPSMYESGFINAKMTYEELDACIDAAKNIMSKLK